MFNEESNGVEELNEESAGVGEFDGDVEEFLEIHHRYRDIQRRVHRGRRGRSLPS